MEQNITRQTAYYASAKDVLEGEYIRREGWEPNFVASRVGVLSRVRLAGVVVDKISSSQFVIDDGSAKIQLNFFDPDKVPNFEVGDPVFVIGRPRESGSQRYLVVEISRKFSSPESLKNFAAKRLEFQQFIPPVPANLPKQEVVQHSQQAPATPAPLPTSEPVSPSSALTLLSIIRELDPGDGASVADVLAKAGAGAESKLHVLINEGEVFELRAGKVKVLE